MAHSTNRIHDVPPEAIGETHLWREWFVALSKLLQSARKLPKSITPPGSDVAWKNSNPYTVDVIFSGGTVTASSFSRDNINYYSTGMTTGVVSLSPGDHLKITYTVAPTMTEVPRACG